MRGWRTGAQSECSRCEITVAAGNAIEEEGKVELLSFDMRIQTSTTGTLRDGKRRICPSLCSLDYVMVLVASGLHCDYAKMIHVHCW